MLDRRAAGRGIRDPLGQAPRIAVLEDDDALRDDILLPAFSARGFDAEGFARRLRHRSVWSSVHA